MLQPFPLCIHEQQEELSDAYHDNVTLLNAGKRAAVLCTGPAGDGSGNQPLNTDESIQPRLMLVCIQV